eukprot:sb/3462891/
MEMFLFDIVPPSLDGDWSEGCLDAFYSMTENMRFFLVIKQADQGGESDIKQVDLRGKEIPSVRDFLVFLEHAKHSTPPAPSTPSTPFKAIQPRVSKQPIRTRYLGHVTGYQEPYSKWPEGEQLDSFLMVDLCFAVGPDDFHVIPTSEMNNVEMLSQEVQTYMNQKGHCYALSQLSKGNMCIARFAEDGQYYRAVVEGSHGTQVIIKYCDYGNVVKVSHKDLFEMPSHLSLMPCMALPCSLARVLPADKKQWSERACETFQKLTYDKRLYGELVKLDARGKHEVNLIDTTRGNTDVNIADELVRMRLARYPPSVFHCRLHGAYLSEATKPPLLVDCQIGDMGVSNPKGLISRVQIMEFVTPETVRVRLVDCGRDVDVGRMSLYELLPEFSLEEHPPLVAQCSLMGIKPTEGADAGEWSGEVCKSIRKWMTQKIMKEKRNLQLTIMIYQVDTGQHSMTPVGHVHKLCLCPEVPTLVVPVVVADVEPDWVACPDGIWTPIVAHHLYEEIVNEECTISVKIYQVDTGQHSMTPVGHVHKLCLCPEVPTLVVPVVVADVEPDWVACPDGIWTPIVAHHLYEEIVNEECTISVKSSDSLGSAASYTANITLDKGLDVAKFLIKMEFAMSTGTKHFIYHRWRAKLHCIPV